MALFIATHTNVSQSNVLPASSTQECHCVPSDVPLEGCPPSAVLLNFATSNLKQVAFFCAVCHSFGKATALSMTPSSQPPAGHLLLTASTQDCQSSRSASSVVRHSVKFLIRATSTKQQSVDSDTYGAGYNGGTRDHAFVLTNNLRRRWRYSYLAQGHKKEPQCPLILNGSHHAILVQCQIGKLVDANPSVKRLIKAVCALSCTPTRN